MLTHTKCPCVTFNMWLLFSLLCMLSCWEVSPVSTANLKHQNNEMQNKPYGHQWEKGLHRGGGHCLLTICDTQHSGRSSSGPTRPPLDLQHQLTVQWQNQNRPEGLILLSISSTSIFFVGWMFQTCRFLKLLWVLSALLSTTQLDIYFERSKMFTLQYLNLKWAVMHNSVMTGSLKGAICKI